MCQASTRTEKWVLRAMYVRSWLQWTGINAIICYDAELVEAVGTERGNEIYNTKEGRKDLKTFQMGRCGAGRGADSKNPKWHSFWVTGRKMELVAYRGSRRDLVQRRSQDFNLELTSGEYCTDVNIALRMEIMVKYTDFGAMVDEDVTRMSQQTEQWKAVGGQLRCREG